ncbi:SPFH domain-containing protein (plasmid) [Streptoverticillium reticulum]|uniref:SPFH domain-containing protein n=1 Tax=Streptoverticillium reticulum TaxID=1433415 RepID=UPI0039BFC1D4
MYGLAGLNRGQVGHSWVLTFCGRYLGTVRRTGLVWINPFFGRRRVDVRLRHWRSGPFVTVDAEGSSLQIVVLVVWRVKDTARAVLGVDDHMAYLREQVEAVTARVASQLPADEFHDDSSRNGSGELEGVRSLRNIEEVGNWLTRLLSAECRAVGIEVNSARMTRIEYAPEIAAAIQRRQIEAIDARHRERVLTAVLDTVDETVRRMSARGLVSLDDYEHKALVKDLIVALYTARDAKADVG